MKFKKTVVIIAIAMLAIFMGCSAFQDAVTPNSIESEAKVYVEADPNARGWLPYDTVRDAERIDRKVDYVHLLNQARAARLQEDDDMEYGYLKEASVVHAQAAKEIKRIIFTPEGPVGLLATTLLGGTIGAIVIPSKGLKKVKK